MGGLKINIEWSKRCSRYNPQESRRNRSRSGSRNGRRRRRAEKRTSPDYNRKESWSYEVSMSE
jgi:hypothetical protein